MTITSILVQAEPTEAADCRLKVARTLADRFGAFIVGLGAEEMPPIGFDNGFVNYDALWIANMQEAIAENLKTCGANFHRLCDGFGAGASWQAHMALPAQAMARAARAADLIVAGGRPRKGANIYQTAAPEELAPTT